MKERASVTGEMKLSIPDFVWLAGSVSTLFRIPFDVRLVQQQLPPPYTIASLYEFLNALQLKTGAFELREGVSLPKSPPLPAIAFFRDVPGPESAAGESRSAEASHSPEEAFLKPALLIKSDGDRVLYFKAGTQTPDVVESGSLSELFSGLLLFAKNPTHDGDDDAVGDGLAHKQFGFSWFKPELMKHRKLWRDVLLASLVIQLIGLSTPLFTQVIIDKVVVHQTRSTLIVVTLGLVMFMLFGSAMTWLRQYLVIHTGSRIDAVLGSLVFQHLFRLPAPYFDHRPTGTLVARLHGLETIRDFLTGAAVSLILDLPFLAIFLVIMFWYSWQLSLIALLLLSVITALSLAISPRLRQRLNQQFMLGARNQAFLTEYIAGMPTVKSLQMEPELERRYGDMLATYLSASFSTRQLSNSYNVAANALEQTMTLAILAVGALLVMRNDGFTIGMLIAFQMFAGRMTQPVMRLVGLWQEFQQASIAIKRLGDVMDVPTEAHAIVPARAGDGRGDIEVSDLSFRYSSNHPFLYRGLNLRFEGGKLIVLKGPSGCGKSTLAKLLQGFYPPTEGRIRIDGKDIQYLAANELRSLVSVVPQETILFSGTIYENLLIANPTATFSDIVNACRISDIHTVIEQLPQGYQTRVGENGVGLSGGQRQRLSIARALLKRPRVLILDEATSNLDNVTADNVIRTVQNLKGKVTILVITHSVPKALLADQVITLGEAKAIANA